MLELQKAATALRYKLISGNKMTEAQRKTTVCHLKTQRTFQHINNEILKGYNRNKRISRKLSPINPLEYQSYFYNLDIPG